MTFQRENAFISIYKRVSHRVCSNKDEITTFQHLASKIEVVKMKEEVLLLFDVLAGQKHVNSAAAFITDKKLREGAPLITNSSWKKAKAWKEWWTRERHLRKHQYFIDMQTKNLYTFMCTRQHHWKFLIIFICSFGKGQKSFIQRQRVRKGFTFSFKSILEFKTFQFPVYQQAFLQLLLLSWMRSHGRLAHRPQIRWSLLIESLCQRMARRRAWLRCLVISTASIKYMLQKRWLQQATSLPRIEIRQRVVKKKGEKGKESGGVEATSKKKTILKVISCQFN